MKKIWMTLALALLFLFGSNWEAFAQRGMRQRPRANPNREQRGERYEMLMKMRLVEVLDLSPEQGDRFLPLFNQYRQRTQRILRARGEAMRRLARYVRSQMGNLEEGEQAEEMSEKQIREQLAKLEEIRRAQEASRQEFYQKAGEALSAGQVARLLVFEENFAREVVRNLAPSPME